MKHQGSPKLQTRFSRFIFSAIFCFPWKSCTYSIKRKYYQWKKVGFWLGWFSCWDHPGLSFIISVLCGCLVVDVLSLPLLSPSTSLSDPPPLWASPPSKQIERRPWRVASSSPLPDERLPPWTWWWCLHFLIPRAFLVKYPAGRSFHEDHPAVVPWQRDNDGRTQAPLQTWMFPFPSLFIVS